MPVTIIVQSKDEKPTCWGPFSTEAEARLWLRERTEGDLSVLRAYEKVTKIVAIYDPLKDWDS